MPELPEVETVKRALYKIVIGAKITDLYIGEKKLRIAFPKNLKKILIGRTFKKPFRRAKYCIIPIGNLEYLVFHLGMSGKIRILNDKPSPSKHDHFIISMDNNYHILFNDTRRFGFVDLIKGNLEENKNFIKIGPEPLSEKFEKKYLFNRIHKKQQKIKNILLDQSVVAGLGNIYVNEILFHSCISPKRQGRNISLNKCEIIVNSTKLIIKKAIRAGGTTIKDHIQPDGNLGYFKFNLKVYSKTNKNCVNCNSLIKEVMISSRASFYCPKCQR